MSGTGPADLPRSAGQADDARSAAPADHTDCASCGRKIADSDAPPWTWSRSTDPGGRLQILCPVCARQHARSIEAKLDDQWW